MDHNKGDAKLAKVADQLGLKTGIRLTQKRFVEGIKSSKVKGLSKKEVLPRLMSSTKEPDFNALTVCWNGWDGRCH